MSDKITEKNPSVKNYDSCCTWQDESLCQDCSIKTDLDCRWERKHLLRFLYTMSPALLIAFGAVIVGAVFTGGWWRLGVLVGYYAVFFIVETRILCSHCPYYSEKGIVLHCLANHGFIKFYRYHPEPLNLFERILLIFGFALFGILPLLAQIPSIVVIATFLPTEQTKFIILLVLLCLSVISIIFGFTFLFTRICITCVNFSCPFNQVPDDLVEKYLDKNPDMKQVWIDHGFEESNRK
ncbi:MAG: hypothetical protein EAX90_03095 [Candidatus Heimdallarchaeota archaeon]|nr:hypothetical protein [Candidatus Heimdallarchaeota archaeon]